MFPRKCFSLVLICAALTAVPVWADGRMPSHVGETPEKTNPAPKPTPTKPAPTPKEAPADTPMWDRWDLVLSDITYRHDGRIQVDYGRAKNSKDLNLLLAQLAAADIKALSGNELKAFWINAYNISMVGILAQGEPVDSVKDVLPFFGVFSRKKVRVAGRMLTLDHMEKTILMPRFKDARVHMALNCASQGCPDLLPKAYRATWLESQLDKQSHAFMAMRNCNRVEDGRTLMLSEIFKWYLDDFGGAGGLRLWIKKYGTREQVRALKKKKMSIEYIDYDWSLNGTFNRQPSAGG